MPVDNPYDTVVAAWMRYARFKKRLVVWEERQRALLDERVRSATAGLSMSERVKLYRLARDEWKGLFPLALIANTLGWASPQSAFADCRTEEEREKLRENRRKSEEAWRTQYAEQEAERKAKEAAQQARVAELRSMPYHEYLQTPEWNRTRRWMLKRARFRCQLCSIYGVELHVHHNTYENRGREDYRDLIVLCCKCHGKHHDRFVR